MLDFRVNTFLTVASCGSFSRAAEKLYLSKVSVMRQIDSLEKDTGIILFLRTTHGVKLTPAGELYNKRLRKLKDLSDLALRSAQAVAKIERPVIKIGTSTMRPCTPFFTTLNSSYHQYFKFQIIQIKDDNETINNLDNQLRNNYDILIGFMNLQETLPSVEYYTFANLDCRIALPFTHPLAIKEKLTMSDLENQTLLCLECDENTKLGQMRSELEQYYPNIHIVKVGLHYLPETFNLCESLGCCLVSFDIWDNVHPSLRTIPVDWDYKLPLSLFYSKYSSPSVKQFINMLKNNNTSDSIDAVGGEKTNEL